MTTLEGLTSDISCVAHQIKLPMNLPTQELFYQQNPWLKPMVLTHG